MYGGKVFGAQFFGEADHVTLFIDANLAQLIATGMFVATGIVVTTPFGLAAVQGGGVFAASGVKTVYASGTTGGAILSASGTRRIYGSSLNIVGQGHIDAQGTIVVFATATLVSNGVLSVTVTNVSRTGTAVLNGGGVLSATAHKYIYATGILIGGGTLGQHQGDIDWYASLVTPKWTILELETQ